MTVVIDASVVVAALLDDLDEGAWARDVLELDGLAAPHLMPAEAANIFRRAALSDKLAAENVRLAHVDLLAVPVELFPYAGFGHRVWELRENVTAYDGWYVALAEFLDAPLATLDRRLARAFGPRCTFKVPRD